VKRLRITLIALVTLLLTVPVAFAQPAATTFTGQYYDNAYLGGEPVATRATSEIAFNWGYGAPLGNMPADNFSVTWNGDIELDGGDYRFYVYADDNVELNIDTGIPLLDTYNTNNVGELVSGDISLDPGTHGIQLNYRELTETAYVYMSWESLDDGVDGPSFGTPESTNVQGNLWTASYFGNEDLDGSAIATGTLDSISANWGSGSPTPVVPQDNWSAVFTSEQTLGGGDYQVRVNADDGVRVYVDDALVIDEWHTATATTYTEDIALSAGAHNFIVEYYEDTGQAYLSYDLLRMNTTPDEPENDEDPFADLTVATATRTPLIVREAPDAVNAGIVSTIQQGDRFYIVDQYDATWTFVRHNGLTGYVIADYVQPLEADTPVYEPAPPATDAELISPVYNVNIRAEAGIEFDDIAVLPPDRTVSVIGRNPSGTWFKINYNGIEGWVTAEYTRLTPATDFDSIPVTQT